MYVHKKPIYLAIATALLILFVDAAGLMTTSLFLFLSPDLGLAKTGSSLIMTTLRLVDSFLLLLVVLFTPTLLMLDVEERPEMKQTFLYQI